MWAAIPRLWNDGVSSGNFDRDLVVKSIAIVHTLHMDELTRRAGRDVSPELYTFLTDTKGSKCVLLNNHKHARCIFPSLTPRLERITGVRETLGTLVSAFLHRRLLSCPIYSNLAEDITIRLYRKSSVDMLSQKHNWELHKVPSKLYKMVMKVPFMASDASSAPAECAMDFDCVSVYTFIYQARTCVKCGTVGNNMRKCGECHAVWYCSKECQEQDWRSGCHKAVCNGLKQGNTCMLVLRDGASLNDFIGGL